MYWYPTVPVDRNYLQNFDIFGATIAPYSAYAFPNASRERKKHRWPGDRKLFIRSKERLRNTNFAPPFRSKKSAVQFVVSQFGIKPPKKYPELHPLLAVGTPISYDVRKRPHDGIIPNIYEHFRGYAATAEPVQKLRIVSTDFPWAIDIVVDNDDDDNYSFDRRFGRRTGKGGSDSDTYVSVDDVWNALHRELQRRVDQGEWAIAGQVGDGLRGSKRDSNSPQARMERARDRRNKNGDRDDRVRRIDWLGRKTSFTGFLRDEQTMKEVSLPGGRRRDEEDDIEVWVAKFATGGE